MVTGIELQGALKTVLDVAEQSKSPALSEGELSRAVVEFANQGVLRGPLLFVPGLAIPAAFFQTGMKQLDVTMDPVLPAQRDQLRKDLAAVVAGQVAARTISRLRKSARRIVMTPGGASGRSVHYLPESMEALLAHVVGKLRDDAVSDGGDLRQCKTCGLFFFSSDRTRETGRPREAYCSNECMLQQHRSDSAERVRRYRERQRLKAAKHR